MNPWILIADASNARIYEVDEARHLKLIRELDHPAGRARAQDMVSDEPGRMKKGGSQSVLSAMDPKTTPHAAEMNRFARELAASLHEAVEHGKVNALALVAPPHFLGSLRQELPKPVTQAVVVSLDRDYAHLPEHELRPLLESTIDSLDAAARVR